MPRRPPLPVDVDPLVNPLDVVVPHHRRQESRRTPAAGKKVRVAFSRSEDLAEALRDSVVYLSGPPLRLTITALAEMALHKKLERLQAEYNGAKPFPKRAADLQGGRPIR